MKDIPPEIAEFEAKTRALLEIAWPLAFDEVLGLFVPLYVAAGLRTIGLLWTIYSAVGIFGFLFALQRLA